MRYFVAFLLAIVLSAAHGDSISGIEREKIEHLIAAVEGLEDAQFIRNGKAYDAKPAADHLRLKLRKAGSRVKTAEDFIRYCASSSSVSGEPYKIRFADGRIVATGEYLRQQLARFQGRE